MDDVLVALANIYGSNYPLSDRVRTQLYRVLKEDYRGSEVKFKSHFVHGTITLLESLKEKGFPLTVTEKQADPNRGRQMTVLHMAPPVDRLEGGEFFFQVGHSSPGKLALKFAKYEPNGNLKTQPSNVEEEDYDSAFSLDFFTHLRSLNPLGEVLFRTLIVLPEGSDSVERLQASDYLRTYAEARRGRFRTGSHLSIEESCEESKATVTRVPSENDGEF